MAKAGEGEREREEDDDAEEEHGWYDLDGDPYQLNEQSVAGSKRKREEGEDTEKKRE